MVQKPMKLIGVATVLLVMGAAGGLWFSGVLPSVQHGAALPVPPEPPRLSQAPEYARCLDLLPADPIGALSFARDWLMQGGGEGAAQCEALAQLSLGEADAAAEALERIAARSEAGLAARAVVFGQAAEAWRGWQTATRRRRRNPCPGIDPARPGFAAGTRHGAADAWSGGRCLG
jgi:hypothetical protein